MPDIAISVPVILLDGLLASGSSVISTYVGQSYSFTVVNGNQYMRDLGVSTGYVKAPEGSFEHEIQMLDFYQYIVQDGAAIHDQMYSFLTSKISIAKIPTIVHCTGYAAYAFSHSLPVKQIYWLHATLNDRIDRLLTFHKIEATTDQQKQLGEKLSQIDSLWQDKLKSHLGLDLQALEANKDVVVDTSNLSAEQAFQKLALYESFIDSYNSMAPILPDFHHEWRRWKCLNCKLVLESNKTITQCPRCGNNDPDKFTD